MTCRISDYILVDFRLDLDLYFFQGQIRNLAIFQPKMVLLPRKKANISIELKASNVTIKFDLGHDFDYEFSRSNMEFAIFQPKVVRLPRKANISIELQASNGINGFHFVHDLTFEFSRSNVTLTFVHTQGVDQGFSWTNFEISVSQNGRAD